MAAASLLVRRGVTLGVDVAVVQLVDRRQDPSLCRILTRVADLRYFPRSGEACLRELVCAPPPPHKVFAGRF
jgi:hypothetical protein